MPTEIHALLSPSYGHWSLPNERPRCGVEPAILSSGVNWWERTESNDIPMRVTWFTAKRPPLVLTPKLAGTAGFEPAFLG